MNEYEEKQFSEKNGYHGSKSSTFNVVYGLPGKGTEANPYLIRNTVDWERFAENISNGTNDYSGKFVKLDDSFDNSGNPITKMAGSPAQDDGRRFFKGTFDGNGKTLYVGFTDVTTRTSLFGATQDATIRNLKVAGSLTSTDD